jgi:hypothetical protein
MIFNTLEPEEPFMDEPIAREHPRIEINIIFDKEMNEWLDEMFREAEQVIAEQHDEIKEDLAEINKQEEVNKIWANMGPRIP